MEERLSKIETELIKYKSNLDSVILNNSIQKKEITYLHNSNRELNDQIYYLEKQIINICQYSRRENIEIINIPETITPKNLETHVLEVLRKINVAVSSYEIAAVHRIGKKSAKKPRKVIVRFINRKAAYAAIKGSWKLFKTEFKYYINENLCTENRRIFNRCYGLMKNGEFTDVWTVEGTVYISVSSEEYAIGMLHFSDIDDYLNQDNFTEEPNPDNNNISNIQY